MKRGVVSSQQPLWPRHFYPATPRDASLPLDLPRFGAGSVERRADKGFFRTRVARYCRFIIAS